MEDKILIGKKAVTTRREAIVKLLNVLKGNRWKLPFCQRYSHFDSLEGHKLLGRASRGASDDIELLRCLEEFIPWVEETKPDWFVKQIKIKI